MSTFCKRLRRRELIQIASVIVPISLHFVVGPFSAFVFLMLYLVIQIMAGLDVILLLIGRFVPVALLWAIRVEHWLGPFPWKKHD